MKNLMIYINSNKDFGVEEKVTVKIQIDNSLDLGWKKKDIILATNFDFEYKGVKSLVVDNKNFCQFCPTASKINVIVDLFRRKIIKKRNIYWFHDMDAYQQYKLKGIESELKDADILMPDFGRKLQWATGSFFFKYRAKDIFELIQKTMNKYKIDEEGALCILTGFENIHNRPLNCSVKGYTKVDFPEIEKFIQRIKKANISYNFHSFNFGSNYYTAIKPILVIHFHFLRPLNPANPRPDQIGFFLKGLNKFKIQLAPKRLIKIFAANGIK